MLLLTIIIMKKIKILPDEVVIFNTMMIMLLLAIIIMKKIKILPYEVVIFNTMMIMLLLAIIIMKKISESSNDPYILYIYQTSLQSSSLHTQSCVDYFMLLWPWMKVSTTAMEPKSNDNHRDAKFERNDLKHTWAQTVIAMLMERTLPSSSVFCFSWCCWHCYSWSL